MGCDLPQERIIFMKDSTFSDRVVIDGVEFVRADSLPTPAEAVDGMEYCIVRTYSAGVFAGYIKERNGKEAVLVNSRRIWYWEGACSLSQLAVDGTAAPENCKFAVPVEKTIVTEVIEILSVTEKAKKSIDSVAEWKYENC